MKSDKKDNQGFRVVFQKLGSSTSLIILVLLIFSLLSSISRMKDIDLEISKEKEKIQKLKEENEKLEKDLEFVKSEQYIEQQLRDNLGLTKEGEIVVVLPDEEIVKRYAPRLDEEVIDLPDPNWRKWMKLFRL